MDVGSGTLNRVSVVFTELGRRHLIDLAGQPPTPAPLWNRRNSAYSLPTDH